MQQLRTRATKLAAWRAAAAAMQAGVLAPAVLEEKARALTDLLPQLQLQGGGGGGVGVEAVSDSCQLRVQGRVLRLEGRDPFVQRLSSAARFLAPSLDAAGWGSKPTVAALAELHKRGKELGAPRHERRGLERALKACQLAADGAKQLLPEGVTKQGHLRLKQAAARRERTQRGSKGSFGFGGGGDGEGEEEDRREGGKGKAGQQATTWEKAAAAEERGILSHEALIALIAALLDFPYRIEKELAACLRLLGHVTRLRRAAWGLLGVRTGEDFASLDALLTQAAAVFPALKAAEEPLAGRTELEGAPRFYPQGIAPSAALSSSSASDGGGGGGGLNKRKSKHAKAYRMVKGRWEGRRFSFLPGPNLWLGVERLSAELRLLRVRVPELGLLEEKGNLVLSEDVSDEEEGDGRGKGKKGDGSGSVAGSGEKRKKRGWSTALPVEAVAKARAAAAVATKRKQQAVAADAAAQAAVAVAPVAMEEEKEEEAKEAEVVVVVVPSPKRSSKRAKVATQMG